MRGLALLVAVILLAGCTEPSQSDPSVSVSYQRQVQNDVERVRATLTHVEGIDDWSELEVTGCQAPEQGPIQTPHEFHGCSGHLRIEHVPSGATLYSSR